MKRFLLILVALSILNQSIDIDYCIFDTVGRSTYDDIDSVYELLVENFTGNPNYTGEDNDDDDDSGPKNLQFQKDASSCLYCQELRITPDTVMVNTVTAFWPFINCTIAEGHCFVVSPPPDLEFSC